MFGGEAAEGVRGEVVIGEELVVLGVTDVTEGDEKLAVGGGGGRGRGGRDTGFTRGARAGERGGGKGGGD